MSTSVRVCGIVALLFLPGCLPEAKSIDSGEDGALDVSHPPSVALASRVNSSGYIPVVVRRVNVLAVSWKGDVILELAECRNRINFLAIQESTGRLAYAEQTSDLPPGNSVLWVSESPLAPPQAVFQSSKKIHSLSWSRDGRRLAFADGRFDEQDQWPSQDLYVLNSGDAPSEAAWHVQYLRKIDMGLKARLMWNILGAPELVWSEDGRSIIWLGERLQMHRLNLESQRVEVLTEAARVYHAGASRFLAARDRPWRLVSLPLRGHSESVLVRFAGLAAMGPATKIPESPIWGIVVSAAYLGKYAVPYTIFVDSESGAVLGRMDDFVVGYVSTQVLEHH